MKNLLILLVLAVGLALPCLADDTQTIPVSVSIEEINPELDVTISKVDVIDGAEVWDKNPRSAIDFGTLEFDGVNDVWLADGFYAVDIGVNSNTDWRLQHNIESITGPGGNLDTNVGVTFVKQLGDEVDELLSEYSFASSHSREFSQSLLSGGWLRIYYGIATGLDDAPGTEPIRADQLPGQYNGAVILSVLAN